MTGTEHMRPTSQIIFQRDGRMLVTPGHERERIAASVRMCAQLEAIVAGSYRYRLSEIALWGSAARGFSPETILNDLDRYGATSPPALLAVRIADAMGRFGKLRIVQSPDSQARVACDDAGLLARLGIERPDLPDESAVAALKLRLVSEGWPVLDDRIPRGRGELDVTWRTGVRLRAYQRAAIDAFTSAGNGVVLLPCGAGKTLVGVGAIVKARAPALVLTPSRAVAGQWRRALLDATSLTDADVALASGTRAVRPVTIGTYHAATRGSGRAALAEYPWGMVIFDEVQSLPADVFRLVSAISAPRRLGLSATLVREDGREGEVFAMVGPAIFDIPWVELEHEGWIAPAHCREVRIPAAAASTDRLRYKQAVVERLLHVHRGEPTLVVGSNVASLRATAQRFGLPLITGKTEPARREMLYEAFRAGEMTALALSRVGSVGLDLPTASVMIQISGTYGSRQEEAQRLGRLLRPASEKVASFYTLVSKGTNEEDYARRRQRFLVDQGYEYEIVDAADLPRPGRPSDR
jgi:DNA excision repair protein ERCC-3